MRDDVIHWLALSLVPGIGSVLFGRLLERFGVPEAVFRAPKQELLQVEGVPERLTGEIQKGGFEKKAERELSALGKVGGTIVTLGDPAYPKRLKNIYDPPPLLYVRGKLEGEEGPAVAVVGSRKTSLYGRAVAEKICRDLVRYGVTIVSGLARGIDTIGHRSALSGGGRTLGVLGCGVDVVYPRENRDLIGEVIRYGAILSELPMGSSPEGSHFPKRNRIISGLSLGVVVVEAGRESGSLITAAYALEQGREVFAVPGNVGAEGSRGTNQLIKQGAKLVESSEDILEEIMPQWRKEGMVVQEPEDPGRDLPEETKRLYTLLADTPLHIDTIIRESHLEAGRVSSLLLDLELKGLIVQLPGKCFSRRMT